MSVSQLESDEGASDSSVELIDSIGIGAVSEGNGVVTNVLRGSSTIVSMAGDRSVQT